MRKGKVIQEKQLGEIYGYEENIEILTKMLTFDKKPRYMN